MDQQFGVSPADRLHRAAGSLSAPAVRQGSGDNSPVRHMARASPARRRPSADLAAGEYALGHGAGGARLDLPPTPRQYRETA